MGKSRKSRESKVEMESNEPAPFNSELFPNSKDEGMRGTLCINEANLSRYSNEENEAYYSYPVCISTMSLIGNARWQLELEHKDHEPSLQFIVRIEEKNNSPNWFIQSSVSLAATFSVGTTSAILPWTPLEFKANNLSQRLSVDSLTLHSLFSMEELCFDSVKCSFQLHMIVTRSFGFRRRQKITLDLTQQTSECDLSLQFDSGTLYVNSGYLAQLSEFFAKTIEYSADDDNAELPKSDKSGKTNGLRTITMRGDMLQFHELMLVLYPSKKSINALNVEYLVQLADEFSFLGVLVDCENFLMSDEGDQMDVFMRLEWACRYHMADLQFHCLSKLNHCSEIKEIVKSPAYDTLSYDVMKSLFERLMTMC